MTHELPEDRKQAAESYSETVRRYFNREVIAIVVHIVGEPVEESGETEGKNG